MQRIKTVLLLLLVLPALVFAASDGAAAPKRLLLEESVARQTVWLGQVLSGPDGDRTVIWSRAESERVWRGEAEIPGNVRQLTAATGRLAAVLESGQWQFVNLSTGSPLPGEARLLSLAGDTDSLFALGQVQSGAGTQPATTQPAAGVHLFQMQRSGWLDLGALPVEARGEEGKTLALGFADSCPTVAAVLNNDAIDGIVAPQVMVWQWQKGVWVRRWQWVERSTVARIRVFASPEQTMVWTAAAGRLGQVHALAGDSVRELKLPGEAAVCDVGSIAAEIRVCYLQGGRVMEQRYGAKTLQTTGPAAELSLLSPDEEPRLLKWMQGSVLAMLVLAVLSTISRRGRGVIKLDFRKVRLAPLGRRLAAALIDAVPLVIGGAWLASRFPELRVHDGQALMEAIYRNPDLSMWAVVVTAIYVAVLTITEMVMGRSVGKMAMGLRVVSLDGKRPGVWALFLRNFLRFIDLEMGGIALLMIFMLPLRQRLGDLAAGTVVVADRRENEDESDDTD